MVKGTWLLVRFMLSTTNSRSITHSRQVDIELGLQSSHSTPTSLEVVEHEGISPPQLRRRTKLEKLNPTTCLCLYIRPSFSPLFQHQSRPRPPSAQPWSQGDGLIAMSLPEFTPRMHLPRQIWNAVLTPTSVSDLTRSQNHDGKSILPRLSPQVWDEGRDKLLEELSFVDIYME